METWGPTDWGCGAALAALVGGVAVCMGGGVLAAAWWTIAVMGGWVLTYMADLQLYHRAGGEDAVLELTGRLAILVWVGVGVYWLSWSLQGVVVADGLLFALMLLDL